MSTLPEGRTRLPLMKSSGDTLILVALLLLFAGISFVIASQHEPASDITGTERRSSFAVDPGGWKAFYRLLEKRHDKVMRFQRRPREWPAKAGVVITGPYSTDGVEDQWSGGEAQDALSWVSRGGTLIAFTNSRTELTDALGLRTSEKSRPSVFSSDLPSSTRKSADKSTGDTPALNARAFRAKPSGTPLTVQQPALFLEGVASLKTSGDKRYAGAPAKSIALVGDKLPLVMALSYGNGTILAISDAGVPDNTHLAKSDNARFLTQMVEAYSSKNRPAILFDEYHQGYREANTFWTAIGRPGQLAFWQLTGLFLLIAYSASRRFGLPRPVPAPPRVSSEYVASLAGLYRRARAADAALEAIYKIFWRDLCRSTGMPSDAGLHDAALAAAAQASVPGETERAALVDRITAVLVECRVKIQAAEEPVDDRPGDKKKKKSRRKPALSEADLLRLVTAIETLRKELELGGRSPV